MSKAFFSADSVFGSGSGYRRELQLKRLLFVFRSRSQLPLAGNDHSMKMQNHHLVGKSVMFSLPPQNVDGAVDVDIILGHPH